LVAKFYHIFPILVRDAELISGRTYFPKKATYIAARLLFDQDADKAVFYQSEFVEQRSKLKTKDLSTIKEIRDVYA
jgi:hypothetical protein